MFKRKFGRPLDWMIMLKLYFKHTMTSGPSGVILKKQKFSTWGTEGVGELRVFVCSSPQWKYTYFTTIQM